MWTPDKMQHKKAVSAACADLTCRFVKEASSKKTEMLARGSAHTIRRLDQGGIDGDVRRRRYATRRCMPGALRLADIDFLDVTVRQESMNNVAGQPIQIQLGVVPCYALTVHKTQALPET